MAHPLSFGTLCAQPSADPRTTRPHQLPIYATSSFAFEDLPEGMQVFSGDQPGYLYSRFGNPTIDAVAAKIAALESLNMADEATAYLLSSGMAAISTLCLALLKPGEKILIPNNLYGGTNELFAKMLTPMGYQAVIGNLREEAALLKQLQADPSIKMVYFETPANPTLSCIDLQMAANAARQAGAYAVVDNTFATPYLQQPFLYGAHFVVHSTTKYLNGHGNSTSGAIVGLDEALMKEKVFPALKLIGTNCSPWDAWLLENGMKTLELRMERHCSNALQIAKWLEGQPEVAEVHYPGLESHEDHQLAKQQMRAFGGVVSFELKGGAPAGQRFVSGLQLCSLAPTMGDVDTLVMHPASMSHLRVPPEQRRAAGITDGMIRLSVGIESLKDLIADLGSGLGQIA